MSDSRPPFHPSSPPPLPPPPTTASSTSPSSAYSAFDSYYLSHCLSTASKAPTLSPPEVPIACCYVRPPPSPSCDPSPSLILSCAVNATNATRDATRHAEIVAADERRDGLEGSWLYVTIEPCVMCAFALRRVGVKRVCFGASNPRFGGCGSLLSCHEEGFCGDGRKGYEVRRGVMEAESVEVLRGFYGRENERAPEQKRRKKDK